MDFENSQIRAAVLLDEARCVPVLPTNARKIIELAFDDFVELPEFARVLKQDPAIAARLVGLANSAYFSVANPVLDVEEAIVRVLGLDLTRGVALGMAINNGLDISRCPAFDASRYWRCALATSAAAHRIATELGLEGCGSQEALAGLLQNVGVLVAVTLWSQEMQQVFSDGEVALGHGMKDSIGADHSELTQALLERWGLPDSLRTVLSNTPGNDNQIAASAACLAVANLLLEQADLHDIPDEVEQQCLGKLHLAGCEVAKLPNVANAVTRAWEAAGAVT